MTPRNGYSVGKRASAISTSCSYSFTIPISATSATAAGSCFDPFNSSTSIFEGSSRVRAPNSLPTTSLVPARIWPPFHDCSVGLDSFRITYTGRFLLRSYEPPMKCKLADLPKLADIPHQLGWPFLVPLGSKQSSTCLSGCPVRQSYTTVTRALGPRRAFSFDHLSRSSDPVCPDYIPPPQLTRGLALVSFRNTVAGAPAAGCGTLLAGPIRSGS